MDETPPDQAPKPSPESHQGSGAPSAWRKKRLKLLLIIGGFAGTLILAVVLWVVVHAGKETTDDAQVDADVVQLAPRVAGQVVELSIVENQPVKKGEVLARIDERDYQARVEQAEAELESAQAQADAGDAQVEVAEAAAQGALTAANANLAGSSRSVFAARATLEQAWANLARARADLNLAEVNLRRSRDLRDANAVTQQQLDQAQAQRDAARAAFVAAQASVEAAKQELQRTRAQVSESEGRVVSSQPVGASIEVARANAAFQHARAKSAEAALALARLNLEWTRVLAPDDGVVSRITGFSGALVAVGQTLGQFVPDRKHVTANFKETQVGRMRAGQRADVHVDTYGRTIGGKVESIGGGTGARFSLFPPDNATGNFVKVAQRIPVRIALDGAPPDMVLRAGQSVEVTVYVSQ